MTLQIKVLFSKTVPDIIKQKKNTHLKYNFLVLLYTLSYKESKTKKGRSNYVLLNTTTYV